jgi:hypothetical protein
MKLVRLYNRLGRTVLVESRDLFIDADKIGWLSCTNNRFWSTNKPIAIDVNDGLNPLPEVKENISIGPFTLQFDNRNVARAKTRETGSSTILFDTDGRAHEFFSVDAKELLKSERYTERHPSLIKKS